MRSVVWWEGWCFSLGGCHLTEQCSGTRVVVGEVRCCRRGEECCGRDGVGWEWQACGGRGEGDQTTVFKGHYNV